MQRGLDGLVAGRKLLGRGAQFITSLGALRAIDVICSIPVHVASDKQSIVQRRCVSPRRSPKIVISLSFEDRDKSLLGFISTRHLDQNINNRFGRETGNSGAAKMLDSPN